MSDLRGGIRKWACEYCTYENWPATKKCILCRAPKPPQFIDDDVLSLEQDIYKIAPLICPESSGSPGGSSRSSPASDGACDPANKWACQMCTYLNWPKALKCTQCLTPRPVVQSAVSPSSSIQPLNVDVVTPDGMVAQNNSPSSPEAAKALNNDRNRAVAAANKVIKWACRACTYENWPRSFKCVLCGAARSWTQPSEQSDPAPPPVPVIIDKSNSPDSSISENESSSLKKQVPAPKRRSPPITSFRGGTENIESVGNLGGATASPSIYQQQHDRIPTHEYSCGTHRSCRLNRNDDQNLRQIRNRMRDVDWLWINACQGVVDNDTHAVEAYLSAGGDPARQLTTEESAFLCRPSAFAVGYTLVHLAIRFRREDIMAALLACTDVMSKARKRVPSYVAPDIAAEIMREISSSLRQRKGDFPCYFLMESSTFALPNDIEELPNAVKKQLFDELLDINVQKELEDEEPVINWNVEITDRLGSRLYPLWNRTSGDCLLDSVLQSTWGVMDRDNTLRRALSDSLAEAAVTFYKRWKETEAMQAELLHFSLEESQWEQDWAILLSLASQPGTSLEQIHVFTLAHILRRPIIVYGIKFVKSFHGDNIGLARFQGVYLPLLWEQTFCWRSPVVLGYTRGHFSALVAMEMDLYASIGARGNIDLEDLPTTYLPLTDCEGKILPIHFLQATEIGREEMMLRDWLDCTVTEGGTLVAKQRLVKPSRLVGQMVDEWLQRYQSLAQMASQPGQSRTAQLSSPGGHNLSSDDDTDDE